MSVGGGLPEHDILFQDLKLAARLKEKETGITSDAWLVSRLGHISVEYCTVHP